MPRIKNRSLETLKTWRTGKLGCLYMSAYAIEKKFPDEPSQIEKIALALREKEFKEKLGLYNEIKRQIRITIRNEDYENAAVLRDMLGYYQCHVLD